MVGGVGGGDAGARRRAVGLVCLATVVGVFSVAAPCFKVVDVDPLLRTSWRIQASAALYVAALCPVAWVLAGDEGRAAALAPGVGWRVFVCAMLFLLSFMSWNYCISTTSFVHATVLAQLVPWFVVSGEGALWLATRHLARVRRAVEAVGGSVPAEPPSAGEVAGSVAAVVGLAIASALGSSHAEDAAASAECASCGSDGGGEAHNSLAGTPVTLKGDMAALGNACLYAMYMVWSKWQLSEVPPLLVMGAAHVFMVPITLLTFPLLSANASFAGDGKSLGLLQWPSSDFLFPCLATIAVAAAVGHACVIGAVQRLPPIVVSVALMVLPLPQALVGYEIGVASIPGVYSVVGCGVTLVGVGLVIVSSDRRRKRAEAGAARRCRSGLQLVDLDASVAAEGGGGRARGAGAWKGGGASALAAGGSADEGADLVEVSLRDGTGDDAAAGNDADDETGRLLPA